MRTHFPPEGELIVKRWETQSLKGKTFVFWGEGELGDEIMFAQLAHLFKQHLGVSKLIVVVQSKNVALLSSHPDIDLVVDGAQWKQTLPECDYWEFLHGLLARFNQPFEQLPKQSPSTCLPANRKKPQQPNISHKISTDLASVFHGKAQKTPKAMTFTLFKKLKSLKYC